jgi:hypothetical protein
VQIFCVHLWLNAFFWVEEVMANIKEAIELYLGTLSEEEIKESVSKEILTTSLEVQLA